ncbi:MAG: sterol desaturase family protein [Polyangiaceae bacterium]|nr:sterol desaturase family protein [Polyangiaceae bacterium]
MLPVSLPSFALGAASWTLAEYCIHRFAGHGPHRKPGRGLGRLSPLEIARAFHTEHVAHHQNPSYFAPSWKKALVAVAVVPVVGSVAALAVGRRRGLSFALGFASAYVGYEVMHRRIHVRPPRGRYLRWVYRNHLFHHLSPKVDHGVTVPFWDTLLGTSVAPPQVVRLHPRLVPPWLLDPETGAVRAEHAADYAVGPASGARARPPAERPS